MINKIILFFGILGALAAAEGLNRFGSLVSTFGGADAPIYQFILIISMIGAGGWLLGLFNQSHKIAKWLMLVVILGCIGLMFAAPPFPVNIQIIVGLLVTAVSMVFIRTKISAPESKDSA